MWRRVGALPPPAQQGGSDETQATEERGRRHQGITMQDLKKQTALRLAQEQHRRRLFYGLHQQRKDSSSTFEGSEDGLEPTEPGPLGMQGGVYFQNVPVHGQGDFPGRDMGTTNEHGVGWNQAPHNGPPGYYEEPHYSQPYHYSQPVVDQDGNGDFAHDHTENDKLGLQASEMLLEQVSPRKKGPLGRIFGGDKGNHSSSKRNKLPHGLTVPELKEMTKARLQAEAQKGQPPTNQNPPFSPVYRQQGFNDSPVMGVKVLPMSHNQTYPPNRPPHPDHAISGYNSSGNGHARNDQQLGRNTIQGQNGQFNPINLGAGSRPTPSMVQSSPSNPWGKGSTESTWQVDPYETASVASMNGSDYVGPDSAFRGFGSVSTFDEGNSMPTNRLRSYSASAVDRTRSAPVDIDALWRKHAPQQGLVERQAVQPVLFEQHIPNRRRACTSPTGFSHLLESGSFFAPEGKDNMPLQLFDLPPTSEFQSDPEPIHHSTVEAGNDTQGLNMFTGKDPNLDLSRDERNTSTSSSSFSSNRIERPSETSKSRFFPYSFLAGPRNESSIERASDKRLFSRIFGDSNKNPNSSTLITPQENSELGSYWNNIGPAVNSTLHARADSNDLAAALGEELSSMLFLSGPSDATAANGHGIVGDSKTTPKPNAGSIVTPIHGSLSTTTDPVTDISDSSRETPTTKGNNSRRQRRRGRGSRRNKDSHSADDN